MTQLTSFLIAFLLYKHPSNKSAMTNEFKELIPTESLKSVAFSVEVPIYHLPSLEDFQYSEWGCSEFYFVSGFVFP
jgi:hypothetical protein